MKIGPSNIKKTIYSVQRRMLMQRAIFVEKSRIEKQQNKQFDLYCQHSYSSFLFGRENAQNWEDKGNEESTHFQETTMLDDAVYVNTQFSSQERLDTGQDYQNAILPLKPAKVSAKIQNVVNALQVR